MVAKHVYMCVLIYTCIWRFDFGRSHRPPRMTLTVLCIVSQLGWSNACELTTLWQGRGGYYYRDAGNRHSGCTTVILSYCLSYTTGKHRGMWQAAGCSSIVGSAHAARCVVLCCLLMHSIRTHKRARTHACRQLTDLLADCHNSSSGSSQTDGSHHHRH